MRLFDVETYRFDDIVNELLGLVDLLFSVCHDETVEIFILVDGVRSVGFSFALFHRAFTANRDLCLGLCFHLFQ